MIDYPYDRDRASWDRGRSFEIRASKVFRERGYTVIPSTRDEDYYLHTDFWVEIDKARWSIDCKAMKSIKRGMVAQDRYTYVEFKNNAGYEGWLITGADFIVFEKQSGLVIVNRLGLLTFCKEKCDLECLVDNPINSLYKAYTRVGRGDLISMIDLEDLPSNIKKEWKIK